ncbi:MAG: hypothetical protein QMD01_04360 [Thermodesulfovibrionales bacterium]|nr:hypothetical protein [Thermodesulfovibrionales bacterium]
MRLTLILFTLVAIFIGAIIPQADATNVNIGVSIGDESLKGFYFALEDYYRVPYREVIVIKERGIPHEEIPVVLSIAGRVRVAPSLIIDMRLRGRTWMDIVLHFGLSPEIFYVPVRVIPGPPYGKAYGYYKKWPKHEWKKIVLADDDIVNMVNLKFVSEHYGYSPDEVIKMRGKGKNFVEINDEIRKKKKEKHEKIEKQEKIKRHEKQEKEKSKGKGKKDY